MANYVTWVQLNQPIKGDLVQMQGNPVADTVSPASGVATDVAPDGAQYAVVWADVATQVQANGLSDISDQYQNKSGVKKITT